MIVDLGTTSGSATPAYQVDRSNNIVTVSSQDIITTTGLNNITTSLVAGTPVKVFECLRQTAKFKPMRWSTTPELSRPPDL